MTTGDRIRAARMNKQYTQTELASRLRISKQLMYKYENDIVKNIPIDTLKEIARILDVSPGYLADFDDTYNSNNASHIPEGFIPVPNTTKIPLVGTIACGVPILAEENIEGYVELPDNIRADFALRCRGDSMIGAGIQSGDIVYIREQAIVENGQIAAVMVEDEATLKRFYRYDDTIQLVAENPSVRPLVFVQEEIRSLRIVGLAVGYTHKIIY